MSGDTDQIPRVVNRGESTRGELRNMSVQVDEGRNVDDKSFDEAFLFSDITLEVEGKLLHAHRAILAMWSPVFHAMFTNEFKESTVKNIPLPDDTVEDMEELLRYLYTPGGREMDVETALRLLPTIHRYQVDTLLHAVENRLIGSLAESNAIEYLRLANVYDIKNVKTSAIDRLSRIEMDYLINELENQKIPKDLQIQIFRRRAMKLEETINDIRKSFIQPCLRVESRMERRPANHCVQHSSPLYSDEDGSPCGPCVDTFKTHILELCRRALNKHAVSITKDAAT